MTRLVDGQLRPVETVPDNVETFLFYDRFQTLWYDLCEKENQKLWKPEPSGTVFCLRNLRGQMADGRRCTANMLMVADAGEMTELRRIALSILGDYPAFERQFTGWLSVGGYSYELDTQAFCKWMERCIGACRLERFAEPKSRASNLLFWLQRIEAPRLETDLLRLAVYTSDWKDIQQLMGQGIAWKLKHPCALSPEEFDDIFVRRAPLWELSPEN